MAISILDLPNEILLDILHYLPQSFITSIGPLPPALRGGLSSICRVNKRFNALATPLLYEHIHLDYDALWEGCRILNALVGPNAAVPLKSHSGSKFIREVTVYECAVDLYRSNLDWAANIHRCIGEFIRQIDENQLTSLSILTTDYDAYSELFSNQRNLKTLKLNCSFPDERLDKKIGIDRDSFKRYRKYRRSKNWRTWMSQLDPPIRQSRNFHSLSFEGIQLYMDIITITHLELMPTPVDSLTRPIKLEISSSNGFSCEPRGWNASDGLLKCQSKTKHFASTLRSCMKSRPSLKELNLWLTDIRDLNLYRGTVPETRDWAQEGRTVFDIIFSNFSPVDVALEKLTLNSFDEESFTVFPSRFLVNVTEFTIHPYGQYEEYMDDFVASLPRSLRKLHISVITDKNVTRRALLRHRDTLEVLCLENLLYSHPSAAHIVFSEGDTPRDNAPIDWETLTSDKFPKLREVGAHLAPGVLQEGRVGKNFKFLHVFISFHDDYLKGGSLHSYATESFSSIYNYNNNWLNLRAMSCGVSSSSRIFGEPGGTAVFFPHFQIGTDGKKIMKCIDVMPRQAKYLLPDIELLDEHMRPFEDDVLGEGFAPDDHKRRPPRWGQPRNTD